MSTTASPVMQIPALLDSLAAERPSGAGIESRTRRGPETARMAGFSRVRAGLLCAGLAAGCDGGGAGSDDAEGQVPAIRLQWPLGGVHGRDWVVNNHVDLDPGPGVRDYRGGRKSYDRHRGTDLDVPNFRWMDRGFPVLAAAGGRVAAVHDGEFDRNTGCGPFQAHLEPNLVRVTHADGSSTIYAHLARGSVPVSVGEKVAAGQVLGVVGSSGCSTQPHLHFEVRSPAGDAVDPFLESLWLDPPAYDPPLTLMDFSVQSSRIAGVGDLKDPPPNATEVPADAVLGVGLSLAGGSPGDEIRVRLEGGAGPDLPVTLEEARRHSFWYWNLPPDSHRGVRRLRIELNGSPAATHLLRGRTGNGPDRERGE